MPICSRLLQIVIIVGVAPLPSITFTWAPHRSKHSTKVSSIYSQTLHVRLIFHIHPLFSLAFNSRNTFSFFLFLPLHFHKLFEYSRFFGCFQNFLECYRLTAFDQVTISSKELSAFNASSRRSTSTLCCFKHEFTLFSVKENLRFLLVCLNFKLFTNKVKISAVPESDASFSKEKDKIVTDDFLNDVRSYLKTTLGNFSGIRRSFAL